MAAKRCCVALFTSTDDSSVGRRGTPGWPAGRPRWDWQRCREFRPATRS